MGVLGRPKKRLKKHTDREEGRRLAAEIRSSKFEVRRTIRPSLSPSDGERLVSGGARGRWPGRQPWATSASAGALGLASGNCGIFLGLNYCCDGDENVALADHQTWDFASADFSVNGVDAAAP